MLALIMLQAQTVPGLEHHLESQGEKTIHQLQWCHRTGCLSSIWDQKCHPPSPLLQSRLLKYFKTDFTESWVLSVGVQEVKVQLTPTPDSSWFSLYFPPWPRIVSSSYCFIAHDLLLSWSITIASQPPKTQKISVTWQEKRPLQWFLLKLCFFLLLFFSQTLQINCKQTISRSISPAWHFRSDYYLD